MCHSSHYDAFFPVKINKMWNFAWNFDFTGMAYCRDLKPVPLDLAQTQTLNMPLKPLWCIFPSQNQQNVKFLPEILIFQEPLIIDTWNKCHWIWHTSNPKYIPLKPLWCIFPSQNQQNVKFLPWNFDFSGIAYCRDLKQVPLDLAHLKP